MLTRLINLNESNILPVHFVKTARAVLGIVGNTGGNAGNAGENAGNGGRNAGNWDGNVGNQGDSSWGSLCLLLWLKFRSARWAFHHPIFMGSCPTITHTFFAFYQADEFSFKEMRTWGQSKISPSCICVWCESGELGRRRSSRFPCVTPVVETFSSDRVTFRIPSNMNDGVPLQKQPTAKQ